MSSNLTGMAEVREKRRVMARRRFVGEGIFETILMWSEGL
jgi:hypothetical protein